MEPLASEITEQAMEVSICSMWQSDLPSGYLLQFAMERFTMLLKTVNPSISMDHFPWLCEITRGYIYICICTVYRIDIFPLPRLMTGWYFWLIYNRDILGTSWNHGSRQQPTVMLQPTKRVKLASWHFFFWANLNPQRTDNWLVDWNIFLFSIIYGIILPIDFHIFQDG